MHKFSDSFPRLPEEDNDIDKSTESDGLEEGIQHTIPSHTLCSGFYFQSSHPDSEKAEIESQEHRLSEQNAILVHRSQQMPTNNIKDIQKQESEIRSPDITGAAIAQPSGRREIMTCVLVSSQLPETESAPRATMSPVVVASRAASVDIDDYSTKSISSAPPVLPEYKGIRTSLRLRVEKPHIGRPNEVQQVGGKKLGSCNTIESFLDIVCKKCNISEASIANIAVTFPWLPEGHPHKQLRLDHHVE